MRATSLGTMGTTKETRLIVEDIARFTDTSAVQIATSMLTGNGASVDTCPLFIAHKLRKALTIPGITTKAISAVVWRNVVTVCNTLTCIRIWAIAFAAQFNAMVVYGRSITTDRCILQGLKENCTNSRDLYKCTPVVNFSTKH